LDPGEATVPGRSLKAADFQRALGTRPVARTPHFVLHHLPFAQTPAQATPTAASASESFVAPELSTALALSDAVCVDESSSLTGLPAWRLGLVLPKKLARRSVTRSLLRHQARAAVSRHAPAVADTGWAQKHPADAWVLRLRAPFDRQQFPSAASEALNRVVRLELDALWAALCAKTPPDLINALPGSR
jgi:ribonuclease P protein component